MMAPAIVLLVLGLAAAGFGISLHLRFHRLAKVALVPGTIVRSIRQPSGHLRAGFPVVSFRTLDGADVQTMVHQGRIFSRVLVGKQVKVIYDPAKPETAYIYSAGLRYSGIVWLIVSLGFAIPALVAIMMAGKG